MNNSGARWAPDPSGHHKFRYWDGAGWTPYLSDGQSTYLDPEPWKIPTNGVPGGSAQREHQKRAARAETPEAAEGATAWEAGAHGEQRLAQFLQREVGHSTILLHDRDVPGTKGNIDHLAITRNGVWVIDAKNYTGAVKLWTRQTSERPEQRLYVNGWNQTKLVQRMQWQLDHVRAALGGVPVAVIPAICFVDTDWTSPPPFRIDGVWITDPSALAELLAAPGPFERDVGGLIAARLNEALPGR